MKSYCLHNRIYFFLHAILIALFLFCFLAVLASPLAALAQATDLETLGAASGLPTTNIAILIARIIRAFLMVLGIIFVCLVIYAGFLYLTAQGAPEPIKKAHKVFKQAIIGLFIIFSSYAIVTFILDKLLSAAFVGSTQAIADEYAEPLSGALGAGILKDHYPERDAVDIPRNTRIFVSFKEPLDPASMIEGYTPETAATAINLNTKSIKIYPTALGASSALASDKVVVRHDGAFEEFVFDPVEYLGSADEDTNYTVVLTTNIKKADKSDAFSGSYEEGYAWTFEVSTEIDLTPPHVTSVVPFQSAQEPRNITIEVNFNEAMDPVASTGVYSAALNELFTNISALDESKKVIEGTWKISNAYRTVDFTTTDACGEDPCGDIIYCLPGNQLIQTIAKAATLNENEIPQAKPTGVTFDGLVDAAANSLDGSNDGTACGSDLDKVECSDGKANDNYQWNFNTTDDVEDTVPQVSTLSPTILEDEISQSNDLTVTFNTLLKASSVVPGSVSLWPDPWYEMWFAIRKNNLEKEQVTQVLIEHPTFVSVEKNGWSYWPVLTHEIKSTYQICMYPAIGPTSCSASRSTNAPYCCNGAPSTKACQTAAGEELPDNAPPP